MLRILNAEPDGYASAASQILSEVGHVDHRAVDRSELLADIAKYDAVIVRLGHRIDRAVFKAAPRLLAVATATTGLDHIDVDEATRRGVAVVSLKGETEFLRSIPATAELTWGLILALTRRIPEALDAVRRGRWCRDACIGVDLYGRTLGLVGCGRVGEKVARYGLAFGMRISAFDPFRHTLPEGVHSCSSLLALARESDIVSVHVPFSLETKNLIDGDFLAAMRPGAYLVNTSRGGVVCEAALVEALDTGRLAGAALDVLTNERGLLAGGRHAVTQAMQARANLLITPHIGGASMESMRATEVFIAGKLRALLAQRCSASDGR